MRASTLLSLTLLFAAPLAAQSPLGILVAEQSRTAFDVQGAGARAMGLGGAFIAVADDATAVSFNPAGLAQLLHPEVCIVAKATQQQVAFEDAQFSPRGRVLLVSDSLTSHSRWDPLFLSATVPLSIQGHTLAMQFSVHRQFTLGESTQRTLR